MRTRGWTIGALIALGGMAAWLAAAPAAAQSVLDRLDTEIRQRAGQGGAAIPPAARSGTPYLGAVLDETGDRKGGLRVVGVRPNSPADVAGLRTGDVILRAGYARIRGMNDFAAAMGRFAVGELVSFDVAREGRTVQVTAKLTARPQPAPATAPAPRTVPPIPAPPPGRPGAESLPTPEEVPLPAPEQIPPPAAAGGPELVGPGPAAPSPKADPAARVGQLERRIEQLERRIAELEQELAAARKKP
jgi:hypothetical protein